MDAHARCGWAAGKRISEEEGYIGSAPSSTNVAGTLVAEAVRVLVLTRVFRNTNMWYVAVVAVLKSLLTLVALLQQLLGCWRHVLFQKVSTLVWVW